MRTARRLLGKSQLILVRMDSAFYGPGLPWPGDAAASVTVRMDKAVKKTIAVIDDAAWHPRVHRHRIRGAPGRWISRAEVAEVPFTAFAAQKKADHVLGRLVVRRIPDFNAEKNRTARPDTCSTYGGSTPSSPPPTPRSWTPSHPTRPTVGNGSPCTSRRARPWQAARTELFDRVSDPPPAHAA